VSRLELVACVLGTRLLTAVNLSYKVDPEHVYYYTDSRNSLCWINTPSSKAKTYVFNRTAEIQRATKLTTILYQYFYLIILVKRPLIFGAQDWKEFLSESFIAASVDFRKHF
jgi:hypothetical protein